MRFSIRLSLLVDGAPLSRTEWAAKLGVSKPAISQWLTGKTIPRPEHLAEIVGTLRSDSRVGAEARKRVAELLEAPVAELFETPPAYVGKTLAHYLVKPVREGVVAMLDKLEPGQQYELLMGVADRCREMLTVGAASN